MKKQQTYRPGHIPTYSRKPRQRPDIWQEKENEEYDADYNCTVSRGTFASHTRRYKYQPAEKNQRPGGAIPEIDF